MQIKNFIINLINKYINYKIKRMGKNNEFKK